MPPKSVKPPNRASLRFKIGERDTGNYHLVPGRSAEPGLGYVNHEDLKDM